MKRIVVNDMFLVKRRAQVDDLDDDPIGDHQPFRGEKLRSLLQLIDLKLPPQSLILINPLIGEIPRRRVNPNIMPDILQLGNLILRIP